MIWLCLQPEPLTPAQEQQLIPLLEPDRLARLSGYRFLRSRHESILAGALLRYGWAQEFGVMLPPITLQPQGKPVFVGTGLPHFNLSHCRGAAVCAIGADPVGVDVQPISAYSQRLRRVLTPEERQWIEAEDTDTRFTAVWTRKEAYGKALGCGIGYHLSEVSVLNAQIGALQLSTQRFGDLYLSICAKEALGLSVVQLEQLCAFAEKYSGRETTGEES